MTSPKTFSQMGSNGDYPNSTGFILGMASPQNSSFTTNTPGVTQKLCKVDLRIGGTPGTSPSYQINVQDYKGNWNPAPNLKLTAAGAISGYVYGCAVKLTANNGGSPGTGVNTPIYDLHVNALDLPYVTDRLSSNN